MTVPSARPAPRTQVDRCPGLLRPHRAADGALVRLRLPGGRIGAAALQAVSRAAVDFGDGHLQLTSRGNLQLRGVSVDDDGEAPAALVDAITATGLLPSASHELVRNITCSPLTGLSGGLADLRGTVVELDDMLCRTPSLASLPGRFLFALDDGRGDVVGLTHDLGLLAVGPAHATLTIAGRRGPVVALRDAVPLLRTLALGFLQARGSGRTAAWHVVELPDGGARLIDGLAPEPPDRPTAAERRPGPSSAPALGAIRQQDGKVLLAVSVPLGLLTGEQIRVVAAAAGRDGSGEVILTPWRTLLIPDLTSTDTGLEMLIADVEGAALVTDPNSGWHRMSACTGAPGCVAAAGWTRPIAALLADAAAGAGGRPVHVVACERRCGSPAPDHVEVLVLDASRRQVSRRRAGSAAPTSSSTTIDPITITNDDDDLALAVTRTRNAP